MTDRDQLLEIMARATARWRLGGVASDLGRWVLHDQEMLREGLAAAEAAGWVIVPPDDGR